ncbi:hypothetical protein BDP27DRAFT_1424652, partial [Rhodocollybia butyracea]
VVAASQRLRLRINQLFPELAETSYTWFLPDEDVACILKHVKKVKLDLGPRLLFLSISAYPRSRPKPRPSAGLGSSTEIAAFKARLVAKTTPASWPRSRSRSVQSSAPMVAEDDDVAEFDELDASPKISSAKRRKFSVLSSSARSKIPVNAKVTRSMSKKFANKQLLNSTSVVDSGSEDEHDGSDDSLATAVLRVGPPKGKSTAKSSGKKFSKAPPTPSSDAVPPKEVVLFTDVDKGPSRLVSSDDHLPQDGYPTFITGFSGNSSFLPRSVLKEVISPSYVPTSAQATDPNVWTFDHELLLLANAVALNVGTHSVTFAEFMAAARTTFQIDPRAPLWGHLGKLAFPDVDSIIRAQKAREQSIALCESLTDNLLQEFQLLRSQVTSPAVFMQAILRTHPSKPISLVEWAFLTSLFGWDSPTTFDTTAEFEQFIGSITRAAVVERGYLQDTGFSWHGSPLSPTTSFPATLPALDLEVVPCRAGGSAASGSGSTTV